MVQIIPQDVSVGERLLGPTAQGLGQGFGQGFGDIGQQMLQQQIREQITNKAINQMGKEVPQAFKDIMRAQGIMGQSVDFSRALPYMMEKGVADDIAEDLINDTQSSQTAPGLPSSQSSNFMPDFLDDNPQYRKYFPNYSPPSENVPYQEEHPQSLTTPPSLLQDKAGMQQSSSALTGYRPQDPFNVEKYLQRYPRSPKLAEIGKELETTLDIDRFQVPAQKKLAEKQFYEALMEPNNAYIKSLGFNTTQLEPYTNQLALNHINEPMPVAQAGFRNDLEDFLDSFSSLESAKAQFPDANITKPKEFEDSIEPIIKTFKKYGFEPQLRQNMLQNYSDEVWIESLINPANPSTLAKNNQYLDKIQNKIEFPEKEGEQPTLGKNHDEVVENIYKIWKPSIERGDRLFPMWNALSDKNIPDQVMRDVVDRYFKEGILQKEAQHNELSKIRRGNRRYYKNEGMRRRLSGTKNTSWNIYEYMNQPITAEMVGQ